MSKLERTINSIKRRIDTYTTDYLLGYGKLVFLSKKFEKIIQWNYTSYTEYNGVVKLKDGYLAQYVPKKDVNEVATSTKELAQFCKEKDINFLYVQTPHKICQYEDKEISGILDFSNKNADEFLNLLHSFKIETLDLRTALHEEKLSHHKMFYRTDHHWTAETGLWVARQILQKLKMTYHYDIDIIQLNKEYFKTIVYPLWFLGSQGRKITLSQTSPEDFSLLYPTYKTRLHFKIPSKEIDSEGDFSILYDMSHLEKIDYYKENPYMAFIYIGQPFRRIENNLLKENGHVLIIHDSFGNCVVPFLSMGIKHVDSLDLRNFTGSVKSFIEQEKPETVILLYGAFQIGGQINWTSHKHLFDFR